MSGNGGVDVSGVDPTIDALREVKDVVSPVGRVFGGMGARAIGLFRGRLKSAVVMNYSLKNRLMPIKSNSGTINSAIIY
jgi:hypothetical protein